MGYTHYIRVNPESEQWKRAWPQLVKDMQKIYYAAENDKSIYLCGPGKKFSHDGSEKPRADEKRGIIFNDIDDEGHESFTLYNSSSFEFCKTARKPYDWVVCLTLLRTYNLAPRSVKVSSDGEPEDEGWTHARKVYKELWPDEEFSDIWKDEDEDEDE